MSLYLSDFQVILQYFCSKIRDHLIDDSNYHSDIIFTFVIYGKVFIVTSFFCGAFKFDTL